MLALRKVDLRTLFSFARPAGQILDDFLRQRRRRSSPGLWQKIDEQPLTGDHRTNPYLAHQREPDALAVRIAAHRADIFVAGRQQLDTGIDLRLEIDDKNVVREPDFRLDGFGKQENHTGIATRGADADVGVDDLRKGNARRNRQHGRQQHYPDRY